MKKSTKKKSPAKSKSSKKTAGGTDVKVEKQLDLIDVHPKNAGPIIELARKYRTVVSQRVKLLAKEVEMKAQILEMVKAANLKRLADGVIRFTYDGYTLTVTPQDEKLNVKEVK